MQQEVWKVMSNKTDESLRKEIESLLNEAENYLKIARSKKGKEMQNFEAMLALEYSVKVKEKSRKFREDEEFFKRVNRLADTILDEARRFPLVRKKSSEESEYEEGDVAGG